MLHDGIEIKNTDMGFYIKEFEARGNGKKPAHVSFINGCNVILLPLHPGIKLGYLVNGC